MYKRKNNGWMKHNDFVVLDIICLQLSFIIAYWIRYGVGNPYENQAYRSLAVIIVLADLAVIFLGDSFHHVMERGNYKEMINIVNQVIALSFLSVLYLYISKQSAFYARTVFFAMWIIYSMAAFGVRSFWKMYLKKRTYREKKTSILIVTSKSIVHQVVRNIRAENNAGYYIAGLVLLDDSSIGSLIADERVVADKDSLVEYICHNWVDEVFVNVGEDVIYKKDFLEKIAETGVTVHVKLAKLVKESGKKQFIETIGGYTVLTTSPNYMTQKQAVLKRMLDIAGGITGCLCTAILFLVLAPAIYFSSPGPIFFSQVRVGRNGKRFKIYKFRSMYLNAEERKKELLEQNRNKDGFMFKMDFDPRIIGNRILPNGKRKTGIGNFIRRTSLDEFPQFFNVLKGDMSLVGTRPPTIDEWEKYEHHHHTRLTIKPGITGMWQVSGRSGITDFEQIVNLDRQYINEWSMGMDFRILFKTVGTVLKGEGSL